MDCGLPGSSVQGILQARILEWVAIPFSRDLLSISMPQILHGIYLYYKLFIVYFKFKLTNCPIFCLSTLTPKEFKLILRRQGVIPIGKLTQRPDTFA